MGHLAALDMVNISVTMGNSELETWDSHSKTVLWLWGPKEGDKIRCKNVSDIATYIDRYEIKSCSLTVRVLNVTYASIWQFVGVKGVVVGTSSSSEDHSNQEGWLCGHTQCLWPRMGWQDINRALEATQGCHQGPAVALLWSGRVEKVWASPPETPAGQLWEPEVAWAMDHVLASSSGSQRATKAPATVSASPVLSSGASQQEENILIRTQAQSPAEAEDATAQTTQDDHFSKVNVTPTSPHTREVCAPIASVGLLWSYLGNILMAYSKIPALGGEQCLAIPEAGCFWLTSEFQDHS